LSPVQAFAEDLLTFSTASARRTALGSKVVGVMLL
jgi:hypothetical protein